MTSPLCSSVGLGVRLFCTMALPDVMMHSLSHCSTADTMVSRGRNTCGTILWATSCRNDLLQISPNMAVLCIMLVHDSMCSFCEKTKRNVKKTVAKVGTSLTLTSSLLSKRHEVLLSGGFYEKNLNMPRIFIIIHYLQIIP